MQVPPAGMGAFGPDRAEANAGIVPPISVPSAGGAQPVAGDSVAALLAEISPSDLTLLLEILQAPGDQARIAQLLRATEDAAATRDTGGAMDLFRQLANSDPARAESLALLPSLASIRPEIEQWLTQFTAAAKVRAEGRLAEADQKVETSTRLDNSASQTRPEILLLAATGLMDAGGLANYVRSAAVSEVLLDPSRWVPAEQPAPAVVNGQSADWLGPALAAWLAVGFASAILSWWLQDDWLPVICGAWAGGLVVMAVLAWRRPRQHMNSPKKHD
jgi:hypothetical protein